MAIVTDTSGLVSIFDVAALEHSATMDVINSLKSPMIVPAAILAEVDYMLQSRLGANASIELLEDIEDGVIRL